MTNAQYIPGVAELGLPNQPGGYVGVGPPRPDASRARQAAVAYGITNYPNSPMAGYRWIARIARMVWQYHTTVLLHERKLYKRRMRACRKHDGGEK